MGRKYICPASICCLRGKHKPQWSDLMPEYQVINFAVIFTFTIAVELFQYFINYHT